MASVLHFIQRIQDYHLALFVGVLVIVDAFILLVYTAVEGSRGNLGPTKTEHVENPSDTRGVRYLIVLFNSLLHSCPLPYACMLAYHL